MLSCHSCGKPTFPDQRFCVECGADLKAPTRETAAMVHCIGCGASNPSTARFCGSCGQRFENHKTGPALSSDGFPYPPPRRKPAARPGAPTARLILLEEDGSEGGSLELKAGTQWIGRNHGAPFDEDAYLDPNHAELSVEESGLRINAEASLNGVFFKLQEPCELRHEDHFRVGQELIRYRDLPQPQYIDDVERLGSPNPGYWGRLSVMVSPDLESRAIAVGDEGALLGREAGQLCFPNDGYVSARHCRVFTDNERVWLEDLESSNGTYMRVRPHQVIPYGGLLLIGQQLFRLGR